MRFLLVDAAPEIGHSWATRWDSLRLFTPAEYSSLPGMAFPAAPGTYPGKDEVAGYLKAYAARFDLPVMPNTRVRHLDQHEVPTRLAEPPTIDRGPLAEAVPLEQVGDQLGHELLGDVLVERGDAHPHDLLSHPTDATRWACPRCPAAG